MKKNDTHPSSVSLDYKANRLLRLLSDDRCSEFLSSLEAVALTPGESVYEPHKPLKYIHFPINGVISIVAVTSSRRTVEIATIGNEGMVGLPVFLGSPVAPDKAYVQIPGASFRIETALFQKLLGGCAPLNGILRLYTNSLLVQISQGMVCNRIHPVEQRCARWLLMSHDRAHSQDFKLTQDSLGVMLGIRRSGASQAASLLKERGLIDYSRGTIRIQNRRGLEALCCECYMVVRNEANRIFGD